MCTRVIDILKMTQDGLMPLKKEKFGEGVYDIFHFS
jgi:hypothetical protein